MPFGLSGAPATFQRMMDNLTQDLSESTDAYLDDLVIHSSSWKKHLEHVQQVAGSKIDSQAEKMSVWNI